MREDHYNREDSLIFQITVEQGGKPVPGSPFKVAVEPHMSTKDVIVSGLQPVIFTNAINEFQVDTSKLPKPDDHKIECTIVKPDGSRQLAKVEPTGNGKFKVTHIPKEVGESSRSSIVSASEETRPLIITMNMCLLTPNLITNSILLFTKVPASIRSPLTASPSRIVRSPSRWRAVLMRRE